MTSFQIWDIISAEIPIRDYLQVCTVPYITIQVQNEKQIFESTAGADSSAFHFTAQFYRSKGTGSTLLVA